MYIHVYTPYLFTYKVAKPWKLLSISQCLPKKSWSLYSQEEVTIPFLTDENRKGKSTGKFIPVTSLVTTCKEDLEPVFSNR